MKNTLLCTLSLAALLMWGCKGNSGNKTATDDNPIFQTNPDLKRLTGEINRSPKDAALYFQRATVLYKLQQDSLALKDYKAAAALDTNKAEYQSAVGNLLFEEKDLTGSVEWLKRAIAKNPRDEKAHLKIAKMFLYIKKYSEGLDEINKALRQNAYDPEGYFLKGMIYQQAKDTAKAISSFLTATEVAPDYRDAVVQLGLLYSYKKDSIGLRYLDKALRMDSTDVFPWFAKGVFYQGVNNIPMAKEEYIQCVMHNRHYTDAYFNLGYIYMQEDSVQKAFRQYDIVTKVDPGNSTAYFDRGLCYELMDSIPNAVNDYKLSAALDTSYKKPREALQRLRAKVKS